MPAVRVRPPEEREQPWIVDDGLAGFDFPAGQWGFREAPLSQFVRWALQGQLVPAASMPQYRRVYRVVDGKQRRFRRSQWWTSLQSVRDQEKHEAMRQRQEAANAEREARQKEREEEAERRRQAEQEQERVRRAEESRIHWEKVRRQWAEEDARRAREKAEEDARLAQEQAEREEMERQTLETARAWWGRLSPQQRTELFTAVAEYAWRESNLRVEIPEKPMMSSEYAYGVPGTRWGSNGPCTESYGPAPAWWPPHPESRACTP